MDNQKVFNELVEAIKVRLPNFEIKYKDQSPIQKLIGKLMFFNKSYMTQYISTMFGNVYFTTEDQVKNNYSNTWKILAHEYVHLWDDKNEGAWFSIKYLLPQLAAGLSIFSLAAIWFSNYWLLCLAFLLLAAPIPSPGRKKAEYRGYTMSIAVNYWRYGTFRDSTINYIVSHFTGWGYYKMWPFKSSIMGKFEEAKKDIESGAIFEWENSEPFKDVKAILDANS